MVADRKLLTAGKRQSPLPSLHLCGGRFFVCVRSHALKRRRPDSAPVNITVELPQLPAVRQIYAWERREKEGIGLEQLRFPEELLYSPTHEWVRVEGNRAIIGITDYAQSELGDVTYLELPKVGDTVEAGQPFGVIESVKADEELFAPVSGTVVAVNQNAVDHPEIVNNDPYGDGWLIVVEMNDPNELKGLMTAEQYRQMLEREGAI